MKRFNAWLNAHTPAMRQMFVALGGLSSMRPLVLPDGSGVAFSQQPINEYLAARPPEIPTARWMMFEKLLSEGGEFIQNLVDTWVHSGLWRQGVRVYCPTRQEFIALSQVELQLSWPEYRQPFPVMVVTVPDDLFAQPISSDIGSPAAVICRSDPETRITALSVVGVRPDGSAGASLWGQYWWAVGATRSIEDHIEGLLDPVNVDAAEFDAGEMAKRVAINANLLLTHYGAKRLGSANPSYEAKLTASLAKNHLPESARRANEAALKALPVLYGFDQHVRVFEREDAPASGDHTGREVRPHWRRGHWAHQVHGPRGSLRKLVFRPAVMVNAHRFGGTPADTRVTLTTNGAA
jgi:hypothetical protein